MFFNTLYKYNTYFKLKLTNYKIRYFTEANIGACAFTLTTDPAERDS